MVLVVFHELLARWRRDGGLDDVLAGAECSALAVRPAAFDHTGSHRPTSARWRASRLGPPNPLWGSNGVAFGPDGRLYVAEFLAGRISALDIATGDLDVIVPMDGPVQSPDDLAFGADGSMYIADLVPGRVMVPTPTGRTPSSPTTSSTPTASPAWATGSSSTNSA
ncbi:hypothetical protein SALBM311S_05750 [Streptomyces alboniger]